MTLTVRQAATTLVLLGALSCDRPPDADTNSARQNARRLYIEGMDHVMQLDYGAALASLRASLQTDPGYLPALAALWLDVGHSSLITALLDTVASQTGDEGLARCLMRSAASYRGVRRTLPPAPRRETLDSRWCWFYVRNFHEGPMAKAPDLDSVRSLTRLYPESPYFLSAVLNAPRTLAAPEAVREMVRTAKGARLHPFARAYGSAVLSLALHEIGDDSSALELERASMRDPSWALPGFRVIWASAMISHASLRVLNRLPDPTALAQHVDSTVAAMTAIRRSAIPRADLRARVSLLIGLGVEALDRGRLDEAVELLTSAVLRVDSTRDTGIQAYGRMRLGRALVKAGRAPDAERFLLAARDLGDSARITHVQKEVEHNLLHLYESLGRNDDALRAGEAFVRFASAGTLNAVRMMSARDVGLFLRARGRIDESRRYFEQMLVDIDSLESEHYYAGEYYEMTGALDHARAQYEKGVERGGEPMRALAGMVRVAMAMGDTGGARRWALVHDARRDASGRPEAAPLLPGVLLRTAGNYAARLAFLAAREVVARHSQVSAWSSLTADLASLEHDAGNFERAAWLGDSAVVAAKKVGAAETLLRARALGASARARRAEVRERRVAIAAMESVAAEADRSGGVLLRADMHRLVANALVSSGQWYDALAEFKRAVAPLDSVAGRIAMDPGQAAFRSAQRRAYDEALSAIVHNASRPGAIAAWTEWSTRRKGRTYAVRLPVNAEGGLAQVSAGTAIVDYVLLDTLVAAFVVTPHRSSIVPLAVRPAQVRADAEALRRAVDVRVGSSLDIRRASFPLDIAHRLYRALLEPLESHLAGARMLIVVPDGILSLIPFEALVTKAPASPADYASARYVLDRWIVVSATTVRVDPSAWRLSPERVLVIDPGTATAAKRELEAITNALRRDVVKTLRGSEATRSQTVTAMGNADIIHFIAHAEANEHDPGSSRIDLSRQNGDDGRLDATQVAGLRLDAPLVVLSACETANGRVLDGEGVLSMSRSFLRAGARATVATLWPVGPSAADFADAFYSHLAQANDGAEALRNAKLRMRASGAPPSAWAPYQLFAAPASVPPRPKILATRNPG